MKLFVSLICLVFASSISYTQVSGYKGSRLFINTNIGIGAGYFDRNGDVLSPSKHKITKYKLLPFIYPTGEIGLNYVVSNNKIIKLQYGISWLTSPITEFHNVHIGNSTMRYTIYNPFLLNEFTFGYRFNTKKYIAPISHMFAELELIASFYSLNSGYVYTQKPIPFGTLAIGFYKTFFFQKADYFSGYFGLRFGAPVFFSDRYSDRIQSNLPPNSIYSNSAFLDLRNQHIITKAVQIKLGLQFVIPNKKRK